MDSSSISIGKITEIIQGDEETHTMSRGFSELDCSMTLSNISDRSSIRNEPCLSSPSFASPRYSCPRLLNELWLPSAGSMRDQKLIVEENSSSRLINHAKDADFSVWKIPVEDIIPGNLSELQVKQKTNKLILSSIERSLTTSTGFAMGSMACLELGLTLQTLIDLTKVKSGGEYFDTKKLVDEVFVEHTSSTKCAMIDCLKGSKDSIGQPAVGKMNIFVSYSWKYKMKDLIEAISAFEAKRKSEEPIYYFIDCVCINQWSPTAALSNLMSTIEASEGVILILKPWYAPLPFTRAWCLLEISMALRLEDLPLYIEMPITEAISFRKAIVEKFDWVTKELSNIDARNAEATLNTDQHMIHCNIKDTIGYTTLNETIVNGLNEWLAEVGAQILNSEFSSTLPLEERLLGFERLQILARFERYLGHKENSLKLYEKAFKGLDNDLGRHDKKTIVAMSNFGNQLREMGKYVEAENVLVECWKTAADCLSEYDPVYLIIMNNYGLLKKSLGDFQRAEEILRECQNKGLNSERDGAKPWDNLTRSSNLALVLSAQGKYESALHIFQHCLFDDEDVIGTRHPYTSTDMMNVGTVLWRLGRVKECEEKMRMCYKNHLEVIGMNNIATLMTLWWWTIALVKLGKFPKALSNIEKLETKLEKVLGENDERIEKLIALRKAITVDFDVLYNF